MARVLVTGGTGVLGREIVPRLAGAKHTVRVMSRRSGESNALGDVEWAQGDIMTGRGLADAVREVDIIVHCASSPFKKTAETDVEGTRKLLEAANKAGVANFYYISIVGIDRSSLRTTSRSWRRKRSSNKARAVHDPARDAVPPAVGGLHAADDEEGPVHVPSALSSFQLIDPGEVAITSWRRWPTAGRSSADIADAGADVEGDAAQWKAATARATLRYQSPRWDFERDGEGGQHLP